MGVKTALSGVTLTAGDLQKAELISADPVGLMSEAVIKCQELIDLLTFIVGDIMTPASDSANISTLNTQISALG